MTKNYEMYTRYEFWCGTCGHNVIGWEDETPVQCNVCKSVDGKWDRCEVDTSRSPEDMNKIIDASEVCFKVLGGKL
jgi:hypothetical protein